MATAAVICAAAITAPAASAHFDGPAVYGDGAGAAAAQDLRSPDVRDAARGVVAARVVAPSAPRVEVVRSGSDGFEWGDAAIGAAVGLLLALMGGTVAIVARDRRRRAYPAATS
jgi:hypothetical protein